MEKKKNSRITEIVVTLVIIICLSLILIEVSGNVTNSISEMHKHSQVNK